VHFACVLSKVALYQPTLVTLAPVCSVWSKVTDFASKSPSQMNALTKARSAQTKLMNDIGLLIRVVMSYGGHVLIENPTHSKLWNQPFMKSIIASTSTVHTGRTFLLNRCRVGGIHFKQYKFFTTLPPFATKHMELMCDHHFKHPPCLGRDVNGNSVTRASGVYTREMLFHIISIIGMAAGRPEVLERVSAMVQSANSSLHENNGMECFPTFENATVESYLYENADWAEIMHESYGMNVCGPVSPAPSLPVQKSFNASCSHSARSHDRGGGGHRRIYI
jgi:hypothetical protein